MTAGAGTNHKTKTTGADAVRPTWKIHGTIRIKTTDKDSAGSVGRV